MPREGDPLRRDAQGGHGPDVSYDLALWADVPPFAGLQADDAYALLCDLMDDDGSQDEPVAIITGLLRSLLDRWPALGEPGDEKSPWVTGPEIGHASGASIYLSLSFSGADVLSRSSLPKPASVICTVTTRNGAPCSDQRPLDPSTHSCSCSACPYTARRAQSVAPRRLAGRARRRARWGPPVPRLRHVHRNPSRLGRGDGSGGAHRRSPVADLAAVAHAHAAVSA